MITKAHQAPEGSPWWEEKSAVIVRDLQDLWSWQLLISLNKTHSPQPKFFSLKIIKYWNPTTHQQSLHSFTFTIPVHSLLKDSTKLNTISHCELCLGEIFQWSQCNSQFKHKVHLSTHEQLVHKDVKYQCRHCEYQTGYKKVYYTTHD